MVNFLSSCQVTKFISTVYLAYLKHRQILVYFGSGYTESFSSATRDSESLFPGTSQCSIIELVIDSAIFSALGLADFDSFISSSSV